MLQILKSRMTFVVFLICLLAGFAPGIYSQILTEKEMPDTTYTVKWTLVERVSQPYENKPNEYGITSNSVPAIYCFKLVETKKEETFNTEKEADEFIKNMPTCNDTLNMGDCCKNPIKIKNIKQGQGANSR